MAAVPPTPLQIRTRHSSPCIECRGLLARKGECLRVVAQRLTRGANFLSIQPNLVALVEYARISRAGLSAIIVVKYPTATGGSFDAVPSAERIRKGLRGLIIPMHILLPGAFYVITDSHSSRRRRYGYTRHPPLRERQNYRELFQNGYALANRHRCRTHQAGNRAWSTPAIDRYDDGRWSLPLGRT